MQALAPRGVARTSPSGVLVSAALDTLLQSLTGLVRAATEYINLRLTPEDPHREQVSADALRTARNRRYYESHRSKTLASEIQTSKTSEFTSLSLKDLKISKEIQEDREHERKEPMPDAFQTHKTPAPSESKTRVRTAVRPPPSDSSWDTIVAWCEKYRIPTDERAVLEVWLDEQRNAKTAKRDPRAAWNRNAPRIRDELAKSAALRARLNGQTPGLAPKPKSVTQEEADRLFADWENRNGRAQKVQ